MSWISKTTDIGSSIPSSLTKNSAAVFTSILGPWTGRQPPSPQDTTTGYKTRTLDKYGALMEETSNGHDDFTTTTRPRTALFPDNVVATPLTKSALVLGLQHTNSRSQHADIMATSNGNLLRTKLPANITLRSYSTRQSKNRPCDSLSFACDTPQRAPPRETPKPVLARPQRPSSFCRKKKVCVPEPNDCCDHAVLDRSKPGQEAPLEVVCLKKQPAPKLRCPPPFKLPMEFCAPRAASCFGERTVCHKVEPPEPSFSECLLEFDPMPPSGLSECLLVHGKCKNLQPKAPQLGVLKRNVFTPEVELVIDPCAGECAKLLINEHRCPTQNAGICKMKCKFMGKCLDMPGCDVPESLDCKPKPSKSKPCDKRRAPIPSFAECIRPEFPGPAYSECRVTSINEKMMYRLRESKKPITVDNIEQFKEDCLRAGVTWNCDRKGRYVCKQATKPLECTKVSLDKPVRKACPVKPDPCSGFEGYDTARALN